MPLGPEDPVPLCSWPSGLSGRRVETALDVMGIVLCWFLPHWGHCPMVDSRTDSWLSMPTEKCTTGLEGWHSVQVSCHDRHNPNALRHCLGCRDQAEWAHQPAEISLARTEWRGVWWKYETWHGGSNHFTWKTLFSSSPQDSGTPLQTMWSAMQLDASKQIHHKEVHHICFRPLLSFGGQYYKHFPSLCNWGRS
jgi:hypothetical protein